MPTRSPHPSGASPLTGRYLAKNRLLLLALALADAFLLLRRKRRPTPLTASPRRVLLALGGHLGDAVVATATIDHLRRSLPHCEIGIVLPSWSRVVFDGDPRVRWLHSIDHWKFNRARSSRLARWNQYRRSLRQALDEIRGVGYDAAVDLYAYFPNMSFALWRAGVPIRLGFTSGGLGGLYTHSIDWDDDTTHVAERQAGLARLLTPAHSVRVPLRYSLAGYESDGATRGGTDAVPLPSGSYIVVHMGSGAAERRWPVESWHSVARQLADDGHALVFTGRGPEEAAAVDSVMAGLPRATNLCDQLSWGQLVRLIRDARLVLTVETAAAHIAAATGTASVALWSGITSAKHWGPLGESVSVLTQRTPCAPCFRSRGCAAMTCVRELRPADVVAAVNRALADESPATSRLLAEARVAP